MSTTLSPSAFSDYYGSIMNKEAPIEHPEIQSDHLRRQRAVDQYLYEYRGLLSQQHIDKNTIETLIDSLNLGCTPGMDGVTSEHLLYGKSSALLTILSSLCSFILSNACVPTAFNTGVVIPI